MRGAGYIFTYIAPLAFVVAITMMKEAYDDLKRWSRDRQANNQLFERLMPDGTIAEIPSADIQVGHLIRLHTNQRVPTDMVLLRTTESSGGSFIRTDQLDGETDWKLRRATQHTQQLRADEELARLNGNIYGAYAAALATDHRLMMLMLTRLMMMMLTRLID